MLEAWTDELSSHCVRSLQPLSAVQRASDSAFLLLVLCALAQGGGILHWLREPHRGCPQADPRQGVVHLVHVSVAVNLVPMSMQEVVQQASEGVGSPTLLPAVAGCYREIAATWKANLLANDDNLPPGYLVWSS